MRKRINDSRPHIGLLLITSAWFRKVGLQAGKSTLTSQTEAIAGEIVSRLENEIQIEYQGIIFSEKEAESNSRYLAECGLDGLIIAPLLWCEDQILLAALRNLPRLPCLLCFFIPDKTLPESIPFKTMLKGSGSVGTLQISGYLQRAGYHYRSITGHSADESIYRQIFRDCRSMALKKALSAAVCGILPSPCDQMHVTHVNDAALKKIYGFSITYIPLRSLKELASSQSEEAVSIFKASLNHLSRETDEQDLLNASRYALALEQLMVRQNLEILAINDVSDELHAELGFRPSLENPRLTGMEKIICMEADVAAGLIMYVLRKWTGETPFYTEILNVDLENNTLLMGHAGYHSMVNADETYPVKLVTDIEYENTDICGGVCMYFKYKPGPVTAVNCIFDGSKIRVSAIDGQSLPGPPLLEGLPHLICRIDIPVADFYQKVLDLGVSQHWIIVPGCHTSKLERLCWWLDFEFIDVVTHPHNPPPF